MDQATRQLFQATKSGNVRAMQTALDARADINAKDARQQTPLHWAVSLGGYRAIHALLRSGADRTIKDARGQTAEDVVLAKKSRPSFQYPRGNKTMPANCKTPI